MNDEADRKDTVEDMVKDVMSKKIPAEVDQRLRGQLGTFRTLLDARSLAMRPGNRLLRATIRTMAAVAAAVVLFVAAGLVFDGEAPPSWAEVLERFDSTPFFNATVYVKQHAMAEPVQLEVWMAQGGKLRLRAGNQVIFGENGQTIETVAFAPEAQHADGVQNARGTVDVIVAAVGQAEDFSFDTFVQALPLGDHLSVPLTNQNASVSRDLVVFDITNDNSPEWVRIWALRESRLPVRVLYWDPRSAASVDVALSYANQQPPEFFDPAAFKQNLSKSTWRPADRAYGLLRDTGGLPITPRDVAEWQREGEDRATRGHASPGTT